MKTVYLYTDGACRGNPGPGGWAAILSFNGNEKILTGYSQNTTNNLMEMGGVIAGLNALTEPCQVEVFSDSQYVVSGASKWLDGWIRRGWVTVKGEPVKNAEQWRLIQHLIGVHQVNFHWIRGHNGHEKNERCDALARAEIQRQYG